MYSDYTFYACLLIFCIAFGYFYRQIINPEKKKWIGTTLGILIMLIMSGFHTWHFILMFMTNAGIILLTSKRHCHLASFAFSFLYLLFLRTASCFGLQQASFSSDIIQMMMTLKLVGLAAEMNSAYLTKLDRSTTKTAEQKLENLSSDINPTLMDIFHYSFNYLGIATGPHYRYRTFSDFLNLPFANYAMRNEETLKKLIFVPCYFILYLWCTSTWPVSYALCDEFYNQRSWLYRVWYSWPTFLIFRLYCYSGVVMSECVCTMVGLGAYPVRSQPKPGLGPSAQFQYMKDITNNPALLAAEKYNFKTIQNMNVYEAELCTTVRDGMKNWNMCIQYWLVINVYKLFPVKKLRTAVTMLVSAFWHGTNLGYYVCIASISLYLPTEDIYVKLFIKDNKGVSLKVWEWIIWFCKMQTFAYLSVAFNLLTFREVVRYYNSTYYCGYLIAAVLYLIGLYMLKLRKYESKELKNQESFNKTT